MKTDIGVVSVIYYKCYENALLGNIDKCKLFYNLFQQEFNRADNKKIFQQFLNKDRMEELRLIKKQVESNKIIEEFEPFEPLEHSIEMTPTEIEEEKLVIKEVYKNPSLFEPFLSKNLKIKNIEHPCGPKLKDRCDMVMVDDNRILYPIEFKLNKATHAVVGQIGKYCLHFKLRLSYDLYDKVHGVIVANSYSQYAINELKKRGYTCVAYSGDLGKLKFTEI